MYIQIAQLSHDSSLSQQVAFDILTRTGYIGDHRGCFMGTELGCQEMPILIAHHEDDPSPNTDGFETWTF